MVLAPSDTMIIRHELLNSHTIIVSSYSRHSRSTYLNASLRGSSVLDPDRHSILLLNKY